MRLILCALTMFLVTVGIAFCYVDDSGQSSGLSNSRSEQIYSGGVGQAKNPSGIPIDLAESYQSPQISNGYTVASNAQSLSQNMPRPPDPNTEGLIMPDYNQFKPIVTQTVQASYHGYYPQTGNPGQVMNPTQPTFPTQIGYYGMEYTAGPKVSSTSGSPGYPYQTSCPTCTGGSSSVAFQVCPSQNCQAVYPKPSVWHCNGYYVQTNPGVLNTVAGVYSDCMIPLWSNVGKQGTYWSYEWTFNGKLYCGPEVKNFGCKNVGWLETWFRGDKPGWHILSYYCNDWSNYIYIYVW